MGKVAIVDYGMGNINSIRNMLRHIGYESELTNDMKDLLNAEKVILPGVGNFGVAMKNIKKLELDKVLKELAYGKEKHILGICLGMQLLMTYSEEGDCEGLDLLSGKVKKFEIDTNLYKIPHMGWDYIDIYHSSPLLIDLPEKPRYYFVHSYYVKCDDDSNCIAKSDYGVYFDSAIQKNNVYGTQFHPEKSHKFGMKILKNFMEG